MTLKMKKALRILAVIIIFLIVINTALAAVKTFRVKEGDFVKVTPNSFDPDQDHVYYNYSSPLDELGEWQTDYDDAGEYEIDIFASDGELETKKTIEIVVEETNQPPILKEKKVIIKETQEIDLTYFVEDREHDTLTYHFTPPFNSQGKWKTTYSDEGTYIINLQAYDGEFTENFRIEVEVAHTNEPPRITESFSEIASSTDDIQNVEVMEGESLSYFIAAVDEDGNDISYEWFFNDNPISQEKEGEIYFSYDDSGEHTLRVIISDGEKKIENNWNILVENVNRKPELELLPMTVYENDKISLDVPETDIDGDLLTYTFESPLDEQGEWETTLEDSGKYELEVTASDGNLSETSTLQITVLNVDRVPTLNLPAEVRAKEGEEFLLTIDSEDPDEDELEITFSNLPDDATYDRETRELRWIPDYGFIQRKTGFFSEVLNILRMEHKFLKEKSTIIGVTSCGEELCSQAKLKIVVDNINQAPRFSARPNLTVKETETLNLNSANFIAEDPDGDIVRYFYSYPFNQKDGEWTPTYGDSGYYTVNVTATDGYLETTLPLKITVQNKNRMPTLSINREKIVVNEGEEFSLSLQASDPDPEEIKMIVENLPEGASFSEGIFTWTPSYDSIQNKTDSKWNKFLNQHAYLNKKLNSEKTLYWLNFAASDGEFNVKTPVKVMIKNINRPPALEDDSESLETKEIEARVNEPLLLQVKAEDPDHDVLKYHWDFGFGEEEIEGTNTVERTFTSPGNKRVKVTIGDGREEVTQEINIKVTEPSAVDKIIDSLEQPPLSFKVYVIKK